MAEELTVQQAPVAQPADSALGAGSNKTMPDIAVAPSPAPPGPNDKPGLYAKMKRYFSKTAKLRKVAFLFVSIMLSFYTLAELFEHQLEMIEESSSETTEAISNIDPLMLYSRLWDYVKKCRYVISGADDPDGHTDCTTVAERYAAYAKSKHEQIAKCEANYPSPFAQALCSKEWDCEDPQYVDVEDVYSNRTWTTAREKSCTANVLLLTGAQAQKLFKVTHYNPPKPNSYYLSVKQPGNLIRQSIRWIYKPIEYSIESTFDDISNLGSLGKFMVLSPIVYGLLVVGVNGFNVWGVLATIVLLVPATAFALHLALLVGLSITYGVIGFLLMLSGMAGTAMYGVTAFAIKLFHGKKEIAELVHHAAELRGEAKKLF